jgi:uncharacterized protein (UPF0261 family)
MPKTVALIAALDTRGPEAAYLRDRIRKSGIRTLVIDAGVSGEPAFKPDVDRKAFFAAGGFDPGALRAKGDQGEAVAAASRSAEALLPRLYAKKQIHGAIALGGAAALRALPLGVPKILVTDSPIEARALAGAADAFTIVSPVVLEGLNRATRSILANAANAVAGMVRGPAAPRAPQRPLVALSCSDDTAPCVRAARKVLEDRGCECLVFRADGEGGRAMERLIDEGFFAGVCDITLSEWADELAGGAFPAGPARLDAAARKGVPQIVSAGALDRIRFDPRHDVPAPYRERLARPLGPDATGVRTSVEESVRLGEILAKKVNAANGPVRLILPLKGISALDRDGQPFNDPFARRALFDSIQANLDLGKVELVELDHHINDPAFGEALAKGLLAMMGPQAKPKPAKRAGRAPRKRPARPRPSRAAAARRR